MVQPVPTAGFESVQGRRPTMEDTHVMLDDINKLFSLSSDVNRAYYGVYDGHGGKNAADITAEMLHQRIIQDPDFTKGDVESALRSGFIKTDDHILKTAHSSKWGHGTTAVVCLIIGDSLYIGNTGDSEAVLASESDNAAAHGGNGNSTEASSNPTEPVSVSNDSSSSSEGSEGGASTSGCSATLLTEKHKPTLPSERKRIEEAGGQVIFGRVLGSLAVSKALGDIDFKHPYNNATGDFVSAQPFVKKYQLNPKNPFLIIACDGLWDKLTYEEAIDFVAHAKASGKDPTETSQMIVRHALDLGSLDNITVIVIYLSWNQS